jgi:hypothetical protein
MNKMSPRSSTYIVLSSMKVKPDLGPLSSGSYQWVPGHQGSPPRTAAMNCRCDCPAAARSACFALRSSLYSLPLSIPSERSIPHRHLVPGQDRLFFNHARQLR